MVFCWKKLGFCFKEVWSSWFKGKFVDGFIWFVVCLIDCGRRLIVIIVSWEMIFIIVVFVVCCWVIVLFLIWLFVVWEMRGIRVCSCKILFCSMERCFMMFSMFWFIMSWLDRFFKMFGFIIWLLSCCWLKFEVKFLCCKFWNIFFIFLLVLVFLLICFLLLLFIGSNCVWGW